MPVALLLQQVVTTFVKGAEQLAPWAVLVRVERLLIDRARSAFLTHWFGEGLPRQEFQLIVAIANLDELRRRYEAVRAQALPGGGINLLEPIAGAAGTLVGAILSPAGAIVGIYAAIRLLWRSTLRMLGVIAALIFGPIVAVLALPLGLAFGVLAGTFQRDLAALYALLGAVAELLVAVTGFVSQLLGPREEVRNPLVRQLLELLDRVAALFSLALGAIAVIATRILPLVLPLALQARALGNLASAVIDLVAGLARGFVEVLLDLLRRDASSGASGLSHSPFATLRFVLATLMRVLPTVVRGFTDVLTWLAGIVEDRFRRHAPEIARRIGLVIANFALILSRHPLFRTIAAATSQVRTILAVLPPSPPAASAAPSGGAGSPPIGLPLPTPPTLPDVAAIRRSAGAPPPAIGAETIGAIAEQIRPETLPSQLRVSEEAAAAARVLREAPRSLFAGERARLARELGQTPAEALAALREDDLRFRALLYAVVERVLSPQIRVYVHKLLDLFQAIDEHLYEVRDAPGPSPFPVRDLPDSGLLRPVVRRLNVRSQGGDESTLRRFAGELAEGLRAQTFLARVGP